MIRTNYSGSKCPKCQQSAFEMVEETPNNSNFILHFIRCTSCKTTVGVLEYFNIGDLVKRLMKKVDS